MNGRIKKLIFLKGTKEFSFCIPTNFQSINQYSTITSLPFTIFLQKVKWILNGMSYWRKKMMHDHFLCLKWLLINIKNNWLLILNNFQQRDEQQTLFIVLISLKPIPHINKGEQITFQFVVINFLLSMLHVYIKFMVQESNLRLYKSMSCMID